MQELKKILILNLGGIGDVLLSTPALRALKATHPQARMTLMVVRRAYEVARGLRFVEEVVVFPMGKFSLWRTPWLLWSLRKQRFDLAVNMRTIVSEKGARRIRFILGWVNPRLKAGRDTAGRGSFFDIKIKEPDIGDKYEMEYDIETVEALGARVLDKNIDFAVSPESRMRVDRRLAEAGLSEEDLLVVLHPGGVPSHRWPLENFAQAAKELRKKKACRFVVTGSQQERGLAKRLARLADERVLNLAGLLTLNELGAFLQRCRLFITNDTGPMHIAAALKTPCVALFGPGYLTRYDPRHISDRCAVIYQKTECAPCNKIFCRTRLCLERILPEEVVRVALGLWERTQAHGG